MPSPKLTNPPGTPFLYEHSKRWSAAIVSLNAYIIVTPEYNAGVCGAVKNAVNYLYHEWIGKPAAVVTYATDGGPNASAALVGCLEHVGLRLTPTRPQLIFKDGSKGDGRLAILRELKMLLAETGGAHVNWISCD